MRAFKCWMAAAVLLFAGQPAAAAAEPTRVVKVVIKELPPFVILRDGGPQGFSIDLLDKIAVRVGFTYELEIVDTVPEQLDRLKVGTADLAIAGISITSERENEVDFSQPMFHSGLQILTSASRKSAPSIGASLSKTVWPLVSKLGLLLLLVAHVVWLVRRRIDENFPKSYFRGVGEGLWFAAESMATVGYGEKSPTKAWGRLAAVAWMFLAIFVVANLTGSISADMVSQRLEGSINGPNDLPGKKVATVSGTTSDEYLQSRNLQSLKTGRIEEALELLRSGNADAVVMDSPVLRYYASKEGRGQVELVGPMFSPQDYGIAFPMGSELRKPVNQALLALIEDGSYDRLEQSWFGQSE